MLREVDIERLPNGKPTNIPAILSEANLDQQVKRFIEVAAAEPMDGQLHISHFRKYYGGAWTLRILRSVLSELRQPTMRLAITQRRQDLIPFFEYQLARHEHLHDSEFGYPADTSVLPI